MKKGISLFLALLTLLLCACTHLSNDGQNVQDGQDVQNAQDEQDGYDIAQQYLLEGNCEEAIKAFSSEIEANPDKIEAYIGRGDAYVGLGNTENNLALALEDYRTALKLDDNDLSIYLKIADIHIANDDYEQFQDILGQARSKFGETDEIRACEEKFKSYENYYNIGTRRLQNGEYEDAVSAFATAIELDSSQAGAYIGRGDAYANLDGNLSSARADYETALTLDNSDLTVYLKIVDAYLSEQDIDAAQEALTRAAEKFENSEEILARRETIQDMKDAKVSELLVSNAWNATVQFLDYRIFFPDMQGLCLVGSYNHIDASPFTYTLENGKLVMNDNGYIEEWTFDEEKQCLVEMMEDINAVDMTEAHEKKVEHFVEPTPLKDFFAERTAVPDSEAWEGYWDNLLDIILLCKQKNSDESARAVLQKEQEDWRAGVDQEITSQGFEIESELGAELNDFYVKQRIFELLGLPIEDTDPPFSKPALSEDEAMQIVKDYYGFTPYVEDQGLAFVEDQGLVQRDEKLQYCFRLWAVHDGSTHPSVVGFAYVDAQTGECQEGNPPNVP